MSPPSATQSLFSLSFLAARGVLVGLGPSTAVAAANVPIALPAANGLGVPVSKPGLFSRIRTLRSWDREA